MDQRLPAKGEMCRRVEGTKLQTNLADAGRFKETQATHEDDGTATRRILMRH